MKGKRVIAGILLAGILADQLGEEKRTGGERRD